MGEIGNTFSGLSGKTKEDFGHGQASFVTYLNVFNNSIGQPNMIEKVEIDPKQFQVKQGDILFTTSSETPDEVGMACVWPVNLPNLYLNSFCFGFRPKKEIDINFYAHMLRSPQVRNQITLLAQGISRYNISKTKMMDIRIWLPSESEQRRIGRFLGNIDNLITLHQRKLDNLKKLKSGLLQKMFPKAGVTVPEVRFPGFTGDWEQRKLGEIGFIQTGNTPSTANEKHYSTSGIPWITPSDIYDQVVSVPSRYLSEEGRTAARTAPSDSILVTCIASIGKNALINEECGFNQQINSLTPLEEFDPYFLFIDSYHWSETMRKIAASQTMPIINKTEFSKLTTKIPNLKEQQKIGKFFRKIDSAIALHQRKLFIIAYIK